MARRLSLYAGLIALLTSGFFGLEALLAGGAFYDVSLPLDAGVPLSPVWIWAYLLYYPLCLLPLAVPGFLSDERLYRRVLAGFLVQFGVAWLTFYFFPTRMERVPVEGFSPSALAVRGLYAVDGGHNVFPSLHVANSLYMALLARHYWPGRRAYAAFGAAGLIWASTVLIKQHYLLDVPSGLLVGGLGYALWRRLGRRADEPAPASDPLRA